jgi:hypothetical protein
LHEAIWSEPDLNKPILVWQAGVAKNEQYLWRKENVV